MMAGHDHSEGDLRISTDPAELDLDWLVPALSERAYWALGRSSSLFERSLQQSLSFGAYVDGRQVGFARVVTDEATFAWICDVFVDESVRGRGVGKRLIAAIVDDPRLQGLKRVMLATRDAHGLYAGFGFAALDHPERWMVRESPEPPTGPADDRKLCGDGPESYEALPGSVPSGANSCPGRGGATRWG